MPESIKSTITILLFNTSECKVPCFFQVVYALVCVVGLCGNTLVIYVVLRFSKMQTVTNIYILMLAAADECFLVGIPFLIVTSGTYSLAHIKKQSAD